MPAQGSPLLQWVHEQAAPGGAIKPPNALTATFQIGVLRLLSLRMTERVHEEPLTGYLLGAFASLAPLCASAFEGAGPICAWQYVPKSGGEMNEASTGADFALLIRTQNEGARLAVFQAKRQTTKATVDFHHAKRIPKIKQADRSAATRTDVQPQLLRLWEHAEKIEKDAVNAGINRGERASLDWAHYLIYRRGRTYSVSLDHLRHLRDKYEDSRPKDQNAPITWEVQSPTEIDEGWTQELFWLLTIGADPTLAAADAIGWLDVPETRVEAVARYLIDFTQVFVATQGDALSPFPSPEPAQTDEDDPDNEESPTDPEEILQGLMNHPRRPKRYQVPSTAKVPSLDSIITNSDLGEDSDTLDATREVENDAESEHTENEDEDAPTEAPQQSSPGLRGIRRRR